MSNLLLWVGCFLLNYNLLVFDGVVLRVDQLNVIDAVSCPGRKIQVGCLLIDWRCEYRLPKCVHDFQGVAAHKTDVSIINGDMRPGWIWENFQRVLINRRIETCKCSIDDKRVRYCGQERVVDRNACDAGIQNVNDGHIGSVDAIA